jgi:mercuric ion transport protein
MPIEKSNDRRKTIMLTNPEINPKRAFRIDAAAVVAALLAFGCFLILSIAAALRQGDDLIKLFTSMDTIPLMLISAALVHVCFRFRVLYLVKAKPCASEDEACAVRKMRRNQRVMFWLGMILLLGLIIFSLNAQDTPVFLSGQ